MKPYLNLPIEKIKNLYLRDYKNLKEIADILGVGASTIKRRLKKLGLLRTTSESQRVAWETKKHHPKFGYCWKGGRASDGKGYIKIYAPKHPNSNRGYVLEHRLIMERKIGRILKNNELVHHINGVKDDNRPENLILVSRNNHAGNIKCPKCNQDWGRFVFQIK